MTLEAVVTSLLNSVFNMGAIIFGSYLVKGALWAVVKAVAALTQRLIAHEAKMEVFDSKLDEIVKSWHEVPKIKLDMNEAFKRIRALEGNKDH